MAVVFPTDTFIAKGPLDVVRNRDGTPRFFPETMSLRWKRDPRFVYEFLCPVRVDYVLAVELLREKRVALSKAAAEEADRRRWEYQKKYYAVKRERRKTQEREKRRQKYQKNRVRILERGKAYRNKNKMIKARAYFSNIGMALQQWIVANCRIFNGIFNSGNAWFDEERRAAMRVDPPRRFGLRST
jgi:hypothetical protein